MANIIPIPKGSSPGRAPAKKGKPIGGTVNPKDKRGLTNSEWNRMVKKNKKKK